MITDGDLEERVRLAVPGRPVGASRVVSRGYTNAEHLVVRLADNRSVFVKLAVDELSAVWLRREHEMYQHLRGSWRPNPLGWHDDGALPVLVLEDLSDCDLAPPWTHDRVDAVLATLGEVAAQPAPDSLDPISVREYVEYGWAEVARDPEPFLSLHRCDSAWLDAALPTLLSQAAGADLAGTGLAHLDVRSDNLFFRDGGAVLVDWNHAAVGNPDFDVAFWLPSLRMEGGPEPEDVHPVSPGLVAVVAGFFAARAGLPLIPAAPKVRAVQRGQLDVALPWAIRALGLPPLG